MKLIKIDNVEREIKKFDLLLILIGFNHAYRSYTIFLYTVVSLFCIILTYSAYYYCNNIAIMVENIYNLSTTLCVILDSTVGYFSTEEIKKLTIGCYHTYDYGSLIMRTKMEALETKRAKSIKKLIRTMVYFSFSIMLNQQVPILLKAIKLGTFKGLLIFPVWLPYNIDFIPVQILTILMQEICLMYRQIAIFGCYALLFIPYSHIKAETELLGYALKNIESRAEEMARNFDGYGNKNGTSKNEMILTHCYNRCMRQCAEHHSELLSFFIAGAVPLMGIYSFLFGTGAFSCSLAGYFWISDNPALRIKYCFMAVFLLSYIYMLFWYGEATKSAFLDIADAAYGVNWLKLPKRSQNTLKIMLIRSNQPVSYKLYTGHTIDMETYMVMLKATYYYINLMVST